MLAFKVSVHLECASHYLHVFLWSCIMCVPSLLRFVLYAIYNYGRTAAPTDGGRDRDSHALTCGWTVFVNKRIERAQYEPTERRCDVMFYPRGNNTPWASHTNFFFLLDLYYRICNDDEKLILSLETRFSMNYFLNRKDSSCLQIHCKSYEQYGKRQMELIISDREVKRAFLWTLSEELN